jgi:GNAT superfamily N-acetyltransferase
VSAAPDDARLDQLQVRSHDAAGARALARRLIEVYADIYAGRVGDPFFSLERFAERLARHQSARGHMLVTGEIGGELVGYAYGVTLAADTQWWGGLREPFPEDLTRETGDRTFALNEIMVRAPWRRIGVARRLHDTLLTGRTEERATLLVEQGNLPAKAAYRRWGWRHVGFLQPFPDAPVYDSMVLDLPVHPENES